MTYSFSGVLVRLRRLGAFSMPDCHSYCKDIKQAKEELLKRFKLSLEVINEIGISSQQDIEMAIRSTEAFYKENTEIIKEIVSKFNKPVLIEVCKGISSIY